MIEHDGSSHDAEHTCEMCEQIRAEMAATDSPATVAADSPVEVEFDVAAEPAVEANAPVAPEAAEPEIAEAAAPAEAAESAEAVEATGAAEPIQAAESGEPETAEEEASDTWVLPVEPIVAPTPVAKAAPVGAPESDKRWLLLVAGGAIAVAIVAAVVVAVIYNKKDSTSAGPSRAAAVSGTVPIVGASTAAASTAAPAADVTSAIAWARQQLPLSATLLADAPTAAALKTAGFTVVSADALSSAGAAAPAFEYLVDTPALRQLAVTTPAASAALSAAVPVAIFGPADNQVTIRQAVLDSPTVVSARQAADAKFRASAEAQLLRNPAIHSSGNAAAALRSASLDLRAATVLAYVANSSTVQFANVTASAPETAAGLPIRSIDISVTSQSVMQTIISGLPIAYQPASVTPLSGGAVRMVWPIAAEPLPSLS